MMRLVIAPEILEILLSLLFDPSSLLHRPREIPETLPGTPPSKVIPGTWDSREGTTPRAVPLEIPGLS